MNVQAKVDWIGTPKPYIYKDKVTYDATSIDFFTRWRRQSL